MSWKEKLLPAFLRAPDRLQRETEILKTIQRETGENFAAAAEQYLKYLQENPESRLGRTFLAGTLRLLGQWNAALDLLREQYQLEMTSSNLSDALTTRLAIGQVLYDKGDFDAAIAEFESLLIEPAAVARPLHGITYLSLGTVYLANGHRQEAHDAWKKAIRADKSGIVSERAKELLKNNPV